MMKKMFAIAGAAVFLVACGPEGGQGAGGDEGSSTMTGSGSGQVYDRGGGSGSHDTGDTNGSLLQPTTNNISEGNTGGAASGTVPSSANVPGNR